MKTTETFDVQAIRKDFPILHQELNGRPLVYLDNAATTQKPQAVIDVLAAYYEGYNANIHRGIHTLAEKATYEYELTRKAVQNMIHAAEVETIIFTSTTIFITNTRFSLLFQPKQNFWLQTTQLNNTNNQHH